jgi:hypothetical protein
MKSCLEWYKSTDGETRPEKVNRSKLNGTVKKKLKLVRKSKGEFHPKTFFLGGENRKCLYSFYCALSSVKNQDIAN